MKRWWLRSATGRTFYIYAETADEALQRFNDTTLRCPDLANETIVFQCEANKETGHD